MLCSSSLRGWKTLSQVSSLKVYQVCLNILAYLGLFHKDNAPTPWLSLNKPPVSIDLQKLEEKHSMSGLWIPKRLKILQLLDGRRGRATAHSEVNFEQNNKERNKML